MVDIEQLVEDVINGLESKVRAVDILETEMVRVMHETDRIKRCARKLKEVSNG